MNMRRAAEGRLGPDADWSAAYFVLCEASGRVRPGTDDGHEGLNRQQLGTVSGLHGAENVADKNRPPHCGASIRFSIRSNL